MSLTDEPTGWQSLQYKAQQESDPQRLEQIIHQMNCLLDQAERKNGEDRSRKARRQPASRSSSNSPEAPSSTVNPDWQAMP
jgi:hypothetical protein